MTYILIIYVCVYLLLIYIHICWITVSSIWISEVLTLLGIVALAIFERKSWLAWELSDVPLSLDTLELSYITSDTSSFIISDQQTLINTIKVSTRAQYPVRLFDWLIYWYICIYYLTFWMYWIWNLNKIHLTLTITGSVSSVCINKQYYFKLWLLLLIV